MRKKAYDNKRKRAGFLQGTKNFLDLSTLQDLAEILSLPPSLASALTPLGTLST